MTRDGHLENSEDTSGQSVRVELLHLGYDKKRGYIWRRDQGQWYIWCRKNSVMYLVSWQEVLYIGVGRTVLCI